MRHNRSPPGVPKVGFMTKIRAAGSNGFADTTWEGGRPMIAGRSDAGAPCEDTSLRSERTARHAIWIAGAGNGRRCCTGPTIREKSRRLPLQTFFFGEASFWARAAARCASPARPTAVYSSAKCCHDSRELGMICVAFSKAPSASRWRPCFW